MSDASQEIQLLIEHYFDQTADAAELAQLDSLLSSSGEAVKWFDRFADLEWLLRTQLCAAQQEQDVAELLMAAGLGEKDAVRPASRLAAGWRTAIDYLSTPVHFGLFFATVASISLLLFFAQIPASIFPFAGPAAKQPEQPPVSSGAILEESADCRWAGNFQLQLGEQLASSEVLGLERGRAAFRLQNGAYLRFDAPARFQLLASDRARLVQGRLIARVPAPARGFTVETPTARVVDLGTEFGVAVAADGVTEVHVWRGKVACSLLDPHSASQLLIAAGQSARVFDEGRSIEYVASAPNRFRRSQNAPQTLTSDDTGRIAFRGAHLGLARYRTPSIIKSLDADQDHVLGTDGYLLLNSAVGKNRSGEPFFADALKSLPAYIDRIVPAEGDDAPRVSASFDQYLDIDHPAQPGVGINSGAGSVHSGHVGETLPLLQIHLVADDRPLPSFRLGVLVDHLRSIHRSAELNLPAALRLSSSRGESSREATMDRSRIGDGDWYFFDVLDPEPGEVLTLHVTASTTRAQAIGGLVFDRHAADASHAESP